MFSHFHNQFACNIICDAPISQSTSTAERKLGTHFRLGTDPRRLSKGVPGRWSQNFRWPVLGKPNMQVCTRFLMRRCECLSCRHRAGMRTALAPTCSGRRANRPRPASARWSFAKIAIPGVASPNPWASGKSGCAGILKTGKCAPLTARSFLSSTSARQNGRGHNVQPPRAWPR